MNPVNDELYILTRKEANLQAQSDLTVDKIVILMEQLDAEREYQARLFYKIKDIRNRIKTINKKNENDY